MTRCCLLLFLAVALLRCPSLLAQGDAATISGWVRDQSGASIVGTKVEFVNVETGFTFSTLTNNEGMYAASDLHPGPYRITVWKDGFRTVVLSDLVLNVQDALCRNFTMQLGLPKETITVTSELDEQNLSAAVSTVVDSQFVQNMPLNGRSFQSLIFMTPGIVITTTDPSGQTQFSTNGQRANSNYFTVDGVSANFGATTQTNPWLTLGGTTPAMTSGGGTNALVSVDAMQEFRIQSSTYAPEFGRSPGAQISIVTKSGSNQWHGSAFEYLRNNIFDARNYFDNAQPVDGLPALPKPTLRQNDFGGTVGGPVRREHTFFFFSFEGLRLLLPQTLEGYFFTESAKAAVTGPWAPVINATPTGTGPLYDPTCNNITTPCEGLLKVGYSNPSYFDSDSLRVDHKLTDKVTIFARFAHTPSGSDTIYGLNVDDVLYANTDTVTAGVTATISSTLVNDFRGNWSQQASGSIYHFIPSYGAVTPSNWADVLPPGFGGESSNMGYLFETPGNTAGLSLGSYNAQTTKQLNFVDTLSKAAGTHQLKFGVDYRRIRPYEQPTTTNIAVPFSWNSILSGNVDEDLNLTGDSLIVHSNNWSFFGQDTWKVTPRLTLTYGLRWDINTPVVSDTSGKPLYSLKGVFDNGPLELTTGALWHTDYRAIAPRIGVAYQLNPKTVLRGGFGLFYDLGYGSEVSFAFADFPYYRTEIFTGIPLNFTYQDLANGLYPYQPLPFTTQLGSSNNIITVDPNLKLPVTYQWNAALERQFGPQLLTVTYLGAYGHDLLYNTYLPLQSQGIEFYDEATWNAGISYYRALQLRLMRRMTHNLQALVSYSYSHSSDMGSNDYSSLANTFNGISSVKLPPLTPSDFDIRHVVSISVSYEIPKPSWGGKLSRATFGGWALDGIYKFQSAPPLDVSIQEVDPVLGTITVRPTEVPGQPIWIPDSTQPAGKRLNPAAFTLESNGDSDDALRNSIRSPYGISQVDLALRRRFNITERIKLDFRAEYFNLFNHPMFGGSLGPWPWWGTCLGNTPASCSDANPWFGRVFVGNNVTSIAGQTLNIGLGSQSPQYAPGGPRSGQLSLKLLF